MTVYKYDLIIVDIPEGVCIEPYGSLYKRDLRVPSKYGMVYQPYDCIGAYIIKSTKDKHSREVSFILYSSEYLGDSISCGYTTARRGDLWYMSGYDNDILIDKIFVYNNNLVDNGEQAFIATIIDDSDEEI